MCNIRIQNRNVNLNTILNDKRRFGGACGSMVRNAHRRHKETTVSGRLLAHRLTINGWSREQFLRNLTVPGPGLSAGGTIYVPVDEASFRSENSRIPTVLVRLMRRRRNLRPVPRKIQGVQGVPIHKYKVRRAVKKLYHHVITVISE